MGNDHHYNFVLHQAECHLIRSVQYFPALHAVGNSSFCGLNMLTFTPPLHPSPLCLILNLKKNSGRLES